MPTATGAADVAIYSIELGMVEEIKELRPELEPRCLRQPGIFQQSHIPVVQARPVKEPPPASQRSNRFRNKLRAVKEGRCLLPALRGFSL